MTSYNLRQNFVADSRASKFRLFLNYIFVKHVNMPVWTFLCSKLPKNLENLHFWPKTAVPCLADWPHDQIASIFHTNQLILAIFFILNRPISVANFFFGASIRRHFYSTLSKCVSLLCVLLSSSLFIDFCERENTNSEKKFKNFEKSPKIEPSFILHNEATGFNPKPLLSITSALLVIFWAIFYFRPLFRLKSNFGSSTLEK